MSSVAEEESLFSEESPVSLVPVVSELESSVRSDELSSLREPVLSSASLRSLVWLEVSWVSSLLEQAAADKSSAEAISKAKKG